MSAAGEEEPSSSDAPGSCSYYRGGGRCSQPWRGCGLFGEPRCITEEPPGGWESERGGVHDVARLLAVALGGEGLDTAVVREAYERAEDRVSRGDRESLDVIATAAIATVRSLCDDVEALLEENARLSTLLRQANNED